MTGEIKVEPQRLVSVAGDLDSVVAKIDALSKSLAGTSASYWGTWGQDEPGEQFAKGNGDDGYEQRDPGLQKALASKTDLLESYAQALRDAATAFQRAEKTSATGFPT